MPLSRLETPQQAPPEVAGLWFRFHELQLCQELDVVFFFNNRGFEAWCRIENGKSYDRFLQLVEPLKSRFEIDVYPTHIREDKKDGARLEPPPSLSNNPELLNYLLGAGTAMRRLDHDSAQVRSLEGLTQDLLVNQRILMFAEQTLDWNRRMRRYGNELPALASYGLGARATAGLKARAAALCLQHAEEVDRHALKLEGSLKQVIPAESRRSRGDPDPPKSAATRPSLQAAAEHVSELANDAGRQVYGFIYPQTHTVDLSDLKVPSLLHSLRGLRRGVADFQQVVRRST